MLSVWNKVNKRMMQKLKTDPDAPYPKLYLTSTDSSDAPTQFPCLYIKSLGEPTAGRDFQNTQCYITSTIELHVYSAASPNGSQTEARKIMDAAEHKPEYLRLSQAERERMEKEHAAD